ncbi:MAG TPA: 50S ribosomal protein L15 [Syntrophales bacterium]|nr:50S ribosomal protein L15 [Syntrophales bacterium]HRT62739.1 50S ribosomal protein L15 [Syntrophales bacterium]
MKLNELKPPRGSRRKRKRIGRGDGSGHGGTATKGAKGQKARSGANIRVGFEGGQMPLTRRLPKRGFKNPFRKDIVVVNLGQLGRFAAGVTVDPVALREAGIIKKPGDGVKILAKGSLDRPLKIRVHAVSSAARAKIESAGGSVEVI